MAHAKLTILAEFLCIALGVHASATGIPTKPSHGLGEPDPALFVPVVLNGVTYINKVCLFCIYIY